MFIEIDDTVYEMFKSLDKKNNENEWLKYWRSISSLIGLISKKRHIVFFGRNLCNTLIEASKNTDDLNADAKIILMEFKKKINDIYSLRKFFNFRILVKNKIETNNLCIKKQTKSCFTFEIPLNFFENFDWGTCLIAEDENDCSFYKDFCKIFLKNCFSFCFFSKKIDLNKYLKISFDRCIMHGLNNIKRIIQTIEKEESEEETKKFYSFIFDNDENENNNNQNLNKKSKKNIEKFCNNHISWFHTFENIREMENLIPLATYKRILQNIKEHSKIYKNMEKVFYEKSNKDFYHLKIRKEVGLKSKNWNIFLEKVKSGINKDQKLFINEVSKDVILLKEWKNLFKFLFSWCCSLSDNFSRNINNKISKH